MEYRHLCKTKFSWLHFYYGYLSNLLIRLNTPWKKKDLNNKIKVIFPSWISLQRKNTDYQKYEVKVNKANVMNTEC